MKKSWALGKKGQSEKEFRKIWVLGKKVQSERELGIGEEMSK